MRLITIEKASQEEQPDQTTITTNINYIQILSVFLNINMDKNASDKTDTKQNNLYFTRTDMGRLHNKAR